MRGYYLNILAELPADDNGIHAACVDILSVLITPEYEMVLNVVEEIYRLEYGHVRGVTTLF